MYITTLACHNATPSPSRMTNDSALHRGALGTHTENIDLWVSTGFQMVANCVTCSVRMRGVKQTASVTMHDEELWPGGSTVGECTAELAIDWAKR